MPKQSDAHFMRHFNEIRDQQDNRIDFMPYVNNNSIIHYKLIWTGAKLPLQFVLCDYNDIDLIMHRPCAKCTRKGRVKRWRLTFYERVR